MQETSYTYLYVICEADQPEVVKIGFSIDPARRVKQLQTGHANTLHVFHKEAVETTKVKPIERIIHKTLAHHKRKGEWFGISPDDAVLEIKHALIRYGDVDDLSAHIRGGYF